MKAFTIDRYKPRDGGRITDVPEPVPADGQVLVQIHAAGVNLLDSKIRSGEFKLILPYRMPPTLGNDVAGEVVRVGPGVRRFQVGDEVYGRPDKSAIGTFAELIAMNEADVALKPAPLSMEEAASIPLVGLTAWQALVERASLHDGQKLFIQAGSGGVGTFAIQLAKHLGATVAQGGLLVPVHARERSAAHRDHVADRRRDHSSRSRQGLSFRVDRRGHRHVESGRAQGNVVVTMR